MIEQILGTIDLGVIVLALIALGGSLATALLAQRAISNAAKSDAADRKQERDDLAKSQKQERDDVAAQVAADKQAEWKRQDDVADRLAAAQEAAAAKVEEAAQKVAVATVAQEARDEAAVLAARTLQEGITQIHTLVNSNMTSEMEARLATLVAYEVLLKTVPPTEDTKLAIATTEETIKKLEVDLADRKVAFNKASADLAASQAADVQGLA